MSSSPLTITVTEQHALLDALLCKEGTPKQFRRGVRNYAIACLMLEAGLRVGEVVKLRWEHLFWANRPVTSIIISGENAEKGCEREIPVSTRLSNALKTYHQYYNTFKSDFDNPFAFSAPTTDLPMTTRQVERIINKAAWKALGRPIHPHVLRHTFATKLMRVTSMRTVQKFLGHKHITSTQVYTHPDSEDMRKAISAVESNEVPESP